MSELSGQRRWLRSADGAAFTTAVADVYPHYVTGWRGWTTGELQRRDQSG